MPSKDSNQRLLVKSYFCNSVEEAMERARVDLGPDALLINLREAPPEARRLGECEVVFGIPQSPPPARAETRPQPDAIAELRRQMQELQQTVTRMSGKAAEAKEEVSPLAAALIEAGLSRTLANEIESAVQQRLDGRGVIQIARRNTALSWSPEVVIRETVKELESRFAVAPEIGRIAAFVGPPGAGKTSALVKLAVTRGLMAGRPVRLISIDHYRIGAAEQLRTYAAILGVPCHLAETTAGLAEAIDSAPRGSLLLIDTPGYCASSLEEHGLEFASFLAGRQEIDTHLVLTASMRLDDLRRTVDRFQCFRPAKLLFTRLDETDSMGAIFCESARTGRPLSFFSIGQTIPEDLENASTEKITATLVKQLPIALEAAA